MFSLLLPMVGFTVMWLKQVVVYTCHTGQTATDMHLSLYTQKTPNKLHQAALFTPTDYERNEKDKM